MTELQKLRHLKVHEDTRGRLVSVEGLSDVPFEIARVYYILPGDGSPRGFHAHKDLEQLMICVAGSCRIILDDGRSRSDYRLDQPDRGLMVGPMTWREMHDFSEDTVLLVLASKPFDERDYIRDYNDFVREVKAGGTDAG